MSKINKRQRSENWVEEDKIILIDLVKERVREIENKNTDTNSNAKKVVAWNDLKESFNCMCQGAPRTVNQLKAQWGLMKIKEKKRKAEQRKELFKTGGGPPPVKEVPTEDIGSWLPNEFVVDSNEFDSDNVNQHMLLPTPSSANSNDMDMNDFGKENKTINKIIYSNNYECKQCRSTTSCNTFNKLFNIGSTISRKVFNISNAGSKTWKN
ncbi:uncharacterized protein LOC124541219 isoform X2 [Vanessa cardui]|uniref:uncharacterized protein LOC124535768 isoform X2 n=2 Tax=Vanessa cardui TaxID=171605 RepID=UPI001F13F821|nr:uncharacterized protein LOC124535768 isoform X2 [Vanessa cardui]XP_046975051.1 uncharacterized protein LOC124541219 isoform X2 [Vanessa cardui]